MCASRYKVNLDRFNAAVCVGSCAVYRRAAVEPFGGVAPIEHSEDMYTGYKMTEIGYRVRDDCCEEQAVVVVGYGGGRRRVGVVRNVLA